jgi:hypothetical protein
LSRVLHLLVFSLQLQQNHPSPLLLLCNLLQQLSLLLL